MATRIRHIAAGRTLHLVDIENLAGGSRADRATLSWATQAYGEAVRYRSHDHRIVACGPRLAYEVGLLWPGALLKVGRGIDGADRVLGDHADPSFVGAHYDRVVVGSGDHYFAPVVAELIGAGLDVAVVCRRDALARSLDVVAPVVWLLDEVSTPLTAAVA